MCPSGSLIASRVCGFVTKQENDIEVTVAQLLYYAFPTSLSPQLVWH